MPLGELLDMVACKQIMNGAEEKKIYSENENIDEDMIPNVQ